MRQVLRKLLWSAVFVLGVAWAGQADEVDRYLEAQRMRAGIPGLALAVVHKGEVVKAQGYGLANVELDAPVGVETVFEIGSLTKQFTAVAVLLLAQEGKLSLDDSVTRHLPAAPAAWEPITIRHLLQHTSGLQNYTDTTDFLQLSRTDFSREEIWKLFAGLSLEFAPGETSAYSNTGYYLLGLIVERASGQPFWEFLDQRLFAPLGLRATRNTDPRTLIPRRAAGYGRQGTSLENRDPLTPTAAFAAGALVSTVLDFARWDQALRGNSGLPRSLLEEAWQPLRLDGDSWPPLTYGFGWFINTYRGGRVVWHSGGTAGFSSFVHRFEEQDLTVILLANSGDIILDHWALDIAAFFEPALARPQRAGADLGYESNERLRRALAGLLRGTPEPQLFTPAFRRSLEASSGKGLWQWVASHGPLREFALVETESVRDHSLFRSRAVLGDNTYRFTFTVAPNGEIAQILWW